MTTDLADFARLVPLDHGLSVVVTPARGPDPADLGVNAGVSKVVS